MPASSDTKWIYAFGEGSRGMRDLLGGKGANVAEMTRILGEDRVPGGFTITTAACVAYGRADRRLPDGFDDQLAAALTSLETRTGKRLGDARDPLLVSVRSGARVSMPGMMDTVLNLGLNDEAVQGLARSTGNERFAWDSYRRLVQMYGNVVVGIEGARFEQAIMAEKRKRGVVQDTELDADAMRELVLLFKSLYDFPSDPQEQLHSAIRAVFDSWDGERARTYRRIHRIPDDWGTAANVQQMVFGNKGETSGSGVAFSRDEVTGAPEPSGDFLANAQGEDVVSGVRTPRDIRELQAWQPEVHSQLVGILEELERHYGDMQDTEFTVEEGKLFMLQTRNAKRPAQAAVRFAVDAVHEGLLDRASALQTIDAERLDALLHPTFDPDARFDVLARGIAASPGAARGAIVFTADEAVARSAQGEDVILVRPFTEADDVAGFHAAVGIVTSEGGKASHAALVARGMGVPAVTGVRALEIDPERQEVRLDGDVVLRTGDQLAIDGSAGCVTTAEVSLVAPAVSPDFETVLEWADELRRLDVRANADTPHDAAKARELGAQGVGLCRTEHMFFGDDRQDKMLRAIVETHEEGRQEALAELLPLQQQDFEGILAAMDGLPVTIRLLDPPLHEFLPKLHEVEAQLEGARSIGGPDVQRLEQMVEQVRKLQEVNPMLGTRGVRLGLHYPELYGMQIEAIMRSVVSMRRDGRRASVEIMVPLVAYSHELQLVSDMIQRIGDAHGLRRGTDYLIGTMIELPRACLRADEIAEEADFYSFGTNDLTQTALGFSRDDIEGRILDQYIDLDIFDRSPFETLDGPGVGQLVRMGAWLGRKANHELKLGICGEHGGDPDSIDFFHHSGIDYVSCSPYRVPVARVAAAQAAIRNHDPDFEARLG